MNHGSGGPPGHPSQRDGSHGNGNTQGGHENRHGGRGRRRRRGRRWRRGRSDGAHAPTGTTSSSGTPAATHGIAAEATVVRERLDAGAAPSYEARGVLEMTADGGGFLR